MGKYAPPYEITNKMLDYVASISEKVGRVSERSGLTSRPHLRRNNRIRSIYSSLRIEANSLSLGEVRDVIDGKLVLGEAREIQEVKNAYSAYEQLPVLDPYRLEEMQRIHEIMTRYLIEESGVFRSGEEGVFNGNECIFMAPPAKYVPQLMQSLFEWMNSNKNIAHPLILSAIFHVVKNLGLWLSGSYYFLCQSSRQQKFFTQPLYERVFVDKHKVSLHTKDEARVQYPLCKRECEGGYRQTCEAMKN